VPDEHAVQTRSATAVPAELTYVPGEHVDHAAQLAALFVVLNVPLAHAVQARSVVAVPLAETD
jgi:hypothetical protein